VGAHSAQKEKAEYQMREPITIDQQQLANFATDSRRKRFLILHDDKKFHIWSEEHLAFWRPEGLGYTVDESEAGKWYLDDAWKLTEHCGKEKQIQYVEVLESDEGAQP